MGDSIERLFSEWIAERRLDADATVAGMDRIEKTVDVGSARPQTKAFVGKLLASSNEPVIPGREPEIREVFLTRRRKFIMWWQIPSGQRAIELLENLETLNTTLAKFRWFDLGEDVARALETEVKELDW